MSECKKSSQKEKKKKTEKSDKSPKQRSKPAAESSSDSEEEYEAEGGYHIGGVYIPPAPLAVCSNESVGSRAIITHIVNENFKSYAGRQVLGPFHKSFTSIIGPNGSGKSNVIDSMLFVFGYRASKIRSKKISVLLHHSENIKNVRSCTVAVHFVLINDTSPEEFEVVPNSEFVIARTAYHDNTSNYTINGKRAQFKDVAELLRTHGIDLVHNRFLILQGEVEQIAMMKPKGATEHETGMLEYLEDIIGTSRFKKPLEKLEGQLNDLNEERQDKMSRAKLAEKEKEVLREPMQHAIEYIRKANEQARLLNKMHQGRLYGIDQEIKGITETKNKLEESLKSAKDEIKQCQDEQKQKDAEAKKKASELNAKNKQKEQIIECYGNIECRATRIKEEISQTNKNRKEAIEKKKLEEAKIVKLTKLPEQNEKEVEELRKVEEKLIEEKKVEEKACEKILAEISKETESLEQEKNAVSSRLSTINEKKNVAKGQYDLAKANLESYINNEVKAKAAFAEAQTDYDKALSSLREKKPKVEELRNKIPEAEEMLSVREKELQGIQKENIKAKQELIKFRSQLQEKKNAMSATKSRNKVLDFLMQQKENGALPGVFGRLGDLGGVDAKYDCAVSTACGVLDFVVCDTVKTARDAVCLLKKYNVGRGNFIALDQQQQLIKKFEAPVRTPENVPRLFDLIKVRDRRVLPAFYYGLRDTLLANDLAQARRVAYGKPRHRVVSLKGELIEIVGTLSGGGTPRIGRIGTSATVITDTTNPATFKQLEADLVRSEERVNELAQRQTKVEEEIYDLNRNLAKWKTEIKTLQDQIEHLRKNEPNLKETAKKRRADLESAAVNPKETRRLTERTETLKEEFNSALATSEELESEVAQLNAQINALRGAKTKSAKQKLNSVSKQLDKVMAEIMRLQVESKTSVKDLKKAEKHVQSLTEYISNAEQQILTLQEENQKLTQDGAMANERVEAIAESILQLESEIKELKKRVSELGKKENELKARVIAEKGKIQDVDQQLEEWTVQRNAVDVELKKLQLQEIPDEEMDLELPVYSDEERSEFNVATMEYTSLRAQEYFKTNQPNLETIAEFKKKSEIFSKRFAELEEVTNKRNETRKGFEDIRKARLNDFMAGFSIISSKLKEMYQMITFGGDAELDLSDSLDPFQDGVIFSVRPPKKSWKQISNLSGGEKTLSSLALVFALHYYKPSPLYVMDEIDAALDFKNVSIVGNYIKERTKNSQFIIISLRSNMFELADLLVGIYKTYNCTKSITITPGNYVDLLSGLQQARKHKENDQHDRAEHPPSKMLKTS